ncbi:MAG: DHH family phosphoesterase, partial [Candidatus Cloacimonetes bacterium]|nr:DHH family phosphoesterase [Candidatus Cloacimonadota bacterium]
MKKVLLESLEPGISVGIMSHVEPDGDGFCASVALQRFLLERGMQS